VERYRNSPEKLLHDFCVYNSLYATTWDKYSLIFTGGGLLLSRTWLSLGCFKFKMQERYEKGNGTLKHHGVETLKYMQY